VETVSLIFRLRVRCWVGIAAVEVTAFGGEASEYRCSRVWHSHASRTAPIGTLCRAPRIRPPGFASFLASSVSCVGSASNRDPVHPVLFSGIGCSAGVDPQRSLLRICVNQSTVWRSHHVSPTAL
jgi:hypothetical protein